MKKLKKRLGSVLSILLLTGLLAGAPLSASEPGPEPESLPANAQETAGPSISAKSGLLMDCTTGAVLYEKNPHEAMPPASITKIMTMLLVMEALEDGTLTMDEQVTASAHAASMGGTQIWLREGEQMTVRDLLKATAVASANDAAMALAEHVGGSEEAFVARMNSRAAELEWRTPSSAIPPGWMRKAMFLPPMILR